MTLIFCRVFETGDPGWHAMDNWIAATFQLHGLECCSGPSAQKSIDLSLLSAQTFAVAEVFLWRRVGKGWDPSLFLGGKSIHRCGTYKHNLQVTIGEMFMSSNLSLNFKHILKGWRMWKTTILLWHLSFCKIDESINFCRAFCGDFFGR